VLPALATAQARHEYSAVHMGMPVRIVLYATNDSIARAAANAAFERIASLDADLSDYRADSEVRRIEATAGAWVRIKPTTYEVLARAVEIARLSNGAFDPTIKPVVDLWRAARRTGTAPAPAAIDSARALVSWQRLHLDSVNPAARLSQRGMRIDLGGIAKGYILQEALRTLQRHGVRSALLEAGGDIVAGERPPGRPGWRIALPGIESASSAGIAANAGSATPLPPRLRDLENQAIATSGASAQYVEIDGVRYSHVVDPQSGTGLTGSNTIHVIASDGALADALATTLSIVDPETARLILARFPDVVVYR